jgi:hypothetical protein
LRRSLFPLAALLCVSAACALQGKRPALKFELGPSANAIVRGKTIFRLTKDPFTRPAPVRYRLLIDGEEKAAVDKLPLEYAWESSTVSDGKHIVSLLVRQGRPPVEKPGIPTYRVTTDNGVRPKPDLP